MNRHLATLIALSAVSTSLLAQEKATTESGRKVVIYTDGTWKLDIKGESPSKQTIEFNRPSASIEKLNLNQSKFSIFYNPDLWKMEAQTNPTVYHLQHKDRDGYALIVIKKKQTSMDEIKNLALTLVKTAAPDAKVTFEENRKVNGVDTLAIKVKGITHQGMSFIYYGYCHAGSYGAIQIWTYSQSNLFDKFENDFLNFLNGFIIQP